MRGPQHEAVLPPLTANSLAGNPDSGIPANVKYSDSILDRPVHLVGSRLAASSYMRLEPRAAAAADGLSCPASSDEMRRLLSGRGGDSQNTRILDSVARETPRGICLYVRERKREREVRKKM